MLQRAPSGEVLLEVEGAPPEANEAPELITVHLVGAVLNSGVYRVPPDTRLHELIHLAGGFLEDADQETVNLARPLFDGEQVIIPRCGETSGQAEAKININRAGVEELVRLPGIGEARARQIISYREEHGYFRDIRELMNVSGIGEGIFNNLKDLITVY